MCREHVVNIFAAYFTNQKEQWRLGKRAVRQAIGKYLVFNLHIWPRCSFVLSVCNHGLLACHYRWKGKIPHRRQKQKKISFLSYAYPPPRIISSGWTTRKKSHVIFNMSSYQLIGIPSEQFMIPIRFRCFTFHHCWYVLPQTKYTSALSSFDCRCLIRIAHGAVLWIGGKFILLDMLTINRYTQWICPWVTMIVRK